jgi:PadR family transcriptional regulator PadR
MGLRVSSSDTAIESLLTEWKRGMLCYWALSLVLQQPMYGLEIRKVIEAHTQGRLRLGPSTVYQILRRMERRGLLTSQWEPSSQGPPRAYYRATAAGREVVRRFTNEVLAPGSPIGSALNELSAQVTARFASPAGRRQ